MNIFKKVQILILVLFPAYLSGMNSPSNNWIQEARSSQRSGAWTTQDKNGRTVIVEGEIISNDSKIITSNLNTLGKMYAELMEGPDKALIKSYPSLWLMPPVWEIAIKMLFQNKSLKDILYDDYISEIKEILTKKSEDDVYIFTISETAPDNSKSLLGSGMFSMKSNCNNESIELRHFMIKPEAQGRGLFKILASSIFKFSLHIKRLFHDVNRTNDKSNGACEALGFIKSAEHWYTFDYVYSTDQCQKLQDVAATFQNI